MQKKLIALAIAGLSSTAFAQSTVTIQGLFDTGYQNFSLETAGVKTKTNVWGSASNSATTNLTFVVQEDLGNNMKAGLWLETDPTAGSNQTTIGGAAAPAGATAAGATSVWNSQNYLWVSGNFGKVSLGFMNNFALTSALTAQPFGVGMGGGYSGAFGRLSGANIIGAPTVVAAGGLGARDIRANNSIKWDSPSWSGFTVGLLYRSPNSAGNAAANADGQTQVGLNYNNGPLNVSYAHSNVLGNANGAAILNSTLTNNLLAANYTFGTFTLYGGWTSSKNNANPVGVDARSTNIALKWQATPTIAVMANVLKDDDKLAANQDRNLNALGLDYSLSKRTTAYVRWEDGDNDKANAVGGKFTRTALGLRHSF